MSNQHVAVHRYSLAVLIGFALVLFATPFANAGGVKVEGHAQGVIAIDLDPGEDRGSITLPLAEATHCATGQKMYFVISDASDKDFVDEFGGIRADSLEEAPDDAVEWIDFDGTSWVFCNDAGTVKDDGTDVAGNPNYSPLKRFYWNGEIVTANLPLVWWGPGPGQQMRIDEGGCDPIRQR